MPKTRRNRKSSRKTRRTSRKQRGAGFFDFFTSKPSTPNTTSVPAATPATNVPVTNTSTPPRSFLNRIRNATGKIGNTLRSTRNAVANRFAKKNNLNQTAPQPTTTL